VRRRSEDEAGFTLVELVTTIMLLSVVLSAFYGVLWSVQRNVEKEKDRSISNDSVRLAVQELDRQVRSGNVLYDPLCEGKVATCTTANARLAAVDPVAAANGIQPGLSVHIYTQANADTHNPGNRCVQWRVYSQNLQTRQWSPQWQTDGYVTGWRTVTSNIVNTTTDAAFSLGASAFGGRLMNVSLSTNANARSGQAVRVNASITGRNTEYGFPVNVCSLLSAPPYP
jgi:prepilin-type N-terminal cleavage/methylation domain-containing protein